MTVSFVGVWEGTAQTEKELSEIDTLSGVVISSPLVQKSLMKIPTTYEQIRVTNVINRAGNSAIPALNSMAGVYVQSGALNTNRITIRGVGSRNPFGTNRIKAYYASIPLTGGDGATELDDISSDLVSSIEVLRGGKSAFYGAGLGGIVLLNPASLVQDGWGASVNSQVGSDQLRQVGLTLTHGSEKVNNLLRVTHDNFGGWRENSVYKRQNLLFIQDHKVSFGTLKLLINGTNLYAEIPSSLNLENFNDNPSSANQNWQNVNGREENQKLLVGLNGQMKYGNYLKHDMTLFTNLYKGKEFRPFNDLEDNNQRFGIRSILSFEKNDFKAQFLLEGFNENYQWRTFRTGTDTLLNNHEEERTPITLGLQIGYEINDVLYLEAGLSSNFLEYKVKDILRGTPSDQFAYDNIWSPFIGLSYSVNEHLTFFGSFGHGFSYPSVEETLLPGGQKNPDLRPEIGRTEEIGIRFSEPNNRLALNANVFFMQIDDLLVSERIENDDFFGVNAGTTKSRGLELSLIGKIWSSSTAWLGEVLLTTNTTYALYEFDEFVDKGVDISGNSLPGLPNFINFSSLKLSLWENLTLILDHNLYGKQQLNDENTVSLESFNVANTQLGYRFENKLISGEVNLSINNVRDEQYAGMVVVNASSFGGNAPRYYYPGQPRNYSLGLKLVL